MTSRWICEVFGGKDICCVPIKCNSLQEMLMVVGKGLKETLAE